MRRLTVLWADWDDRRFLIRPSLRNSLAHPNFDHAMLAFGRDEDGRVVEALHLGDWYRNQFYGGPENYEHPIEWDRAVSESVVAAPTETDEPPQEDEIEDQEG